MDAAPPRRPVQTGRLILRPSEAADAEAAFRIRSDWDVARMLRQATYPPDQAELDAWFACHPAEWRSGTAYRFAVERDGRMIGLADIEGIDAGRGSLGYWLERDAWGQGHGTEAAQALVGFAFGALGLHRLVAAHAADNDASARILLRLGFVPDRVVERFSRPRNAPIWQREYHLDYPGTPVAG